MGPPGGRSTGRPSPPPPRGGISAPTARARRKGAHRRHGESQEGVPQAAAWNKSREAAARHPPPPPPPHRPASHGGPGPHPPRQKGRTPPRPRGEPECDPPPRPSSRLKWGPRRTSGPTPAHRDAAQIVPREAGWARTGMVWVATPPMDSRTPRDARFVAYPGKAAPQPANH